jgi:acyl-CoA thioesterase-1
MVKAIKAAGAEVLLVSIPLPPNYGPRYVKAFQGTFEAVAAAEAVRLLPFTRSLLPLNEDMMQADGIHPTAKAQPLMLEALWPALAPLLQTGAGKAIPPETP